MSLSKIKQAYLEDKSRLIKEGSKPLTNELDDFFAWCDAKNIVAEKGAYLELYSPLGEAYSILKTIKKNKLIEMNPEINENLDKALAAIELAYREITQL